MQVSIPKKQILEIQERYHCSEEEALNAFLEAQSVAKEAFEQSLEESFMKKETPFIQKSFTPKEIKEHLDKFVIGQNDYKKRLSIAASYHFRIVQSLSGAEDGQNVHRFRKKNTVIAGPSGSGKTYSVEVLGDLLEIPTNIIDATDYTEAGYVGKSAEDMVRELVDLAPGETKQEKARFISQYGGLIFIDEIDKKAKEAGLAGHDISREGFQRAVLKLLERKYVSIDNPLSPAGHVRELMEMQQGKSAKNENLVSTENILFIIGGSFQRNIDSLEKLVKKRLATKGGRLKEDGSITVLGFSPHGNGDSKSSQDNLQNYYKDAEADDYIRFGLLPELVGRVPIRTYVSPLSTNDLIRIMKETEDSILDQYIYEFSLFGIEAKFTDDAIAYVAQQAEKSKTGARALVSVWENILTEFQFELPGSNFSELIIDRELCKRPLDTLNKLLERSPIVNFISYLRNNYGLQVSIDEEAEKYIHDYADEKHLQMDDAIQELTKGIEALNYMNVEGEFVITKDVLKDEDFFDKLYTDWHNKQTSA